MEKPNVPWGAARAARDLVCETPAFRLRNPSFGPRERSYDRTMLRFLAAGERTLPEASYELSNIHAVLLDERGQLITRRSHESNRQTLLGPVCTWGHELYDEQLSRAASILYEVEARVDHRRTLFSSKLLPVDLDSEARQPWLTAEGGFADDRLMQLSIGTFYSRSDLEVSLMATTTCVHDGHRTELELMLLDEAGALLANKWMSISIGTTGVGYNDSSIRLEKKIARAVHKLEVRGRSEVRTFGRIGPILLDDAEGKKPPAAN
jgi:hypothetical protein